MKNTYISFLVIEKEKKTSELNWIELNWMIHKFLLFYFQKNNGKNNWL